MFSCLDFDWVSARTQCSLPVIFQRLKSDLQDDINKKNEIEGKNQFARFRVSFSNTRITVSLVEAGNLLLDPVFFEITRLAIEVRDANNQLLFSAVPTLCDDGVCRLKINGEERELWHLRKRALEDFLFR